MKGTTFRRGPRQVAKPAKPTAAELSRTLAAARERTHSEHQEPLERAVQAVFEQAGEDAARRFRAKALNHLIAAAPSPGASMVALYPEPEQAVAVAQPDGVPASEIHLTLAFLGELDPDQAETAAAAVRTAATESGPLEGEVGGVATFLGDGESYPSVLLPDIVGLADLRYAVCEALDAAGVPYAENHDFVPHLTISYGQEPVPPSTELFGKPLLFSTLTVARGDSPVREFPLGDEVLALTASANWTAPYPDEILNVEALVQKIRESSDPVRRAAIEAAMTGALRKAGLSFDVTNAFVDGVLSLAGQHVTAIAETTRLNVMRTVRIAYEKGLTIPETAQLIQAGMADASPWRARMIARTELAGVVNGGGLAAMQTVSQATGDNYSKRWMTAPGAPSPRHENYDGLDGQTVPLDQPFDVGGDQLNYPGDPDGDSGEVINCRCAIEYVDASGGQVGEGTADEGASPEDVGLPEGGGDEVGTISVAPLSEFPAGTTSDMATRATQLAVTALETPKRAEPAVTRALKATTAKHGVKMYGLDYRLKTPDSFARKVVQDSVDKSIPLEQAAGEIGDALRYTALLPEGNYAADAKAILSDLEAKGFQIEKVSNYWGSSYYRGLNLKLSYRGQTFELQFHTDASIVVKEERSHPLYKQLRISGNQAEQEKLMAAIEQVWKQVPVPGGAVGWSYP